MAISQQLTQTVAGLAFVQMAPAKPKKTLGSHRFVTHITEKLSHAWI